MKKILLILFILLMSSDVIAQTEDSMYTVPLDNFSEEVYSETASTYKLSVDSSYKMPDTPFQKVIGAAQSGNKFYITVISGEIDNGCVEQLSDKYIQNTRLLDCDNPQITAFKKKFANSHDVVNDVEEFVYGYITNKITGIPIISAAEILKNRAGDCTEHTVLAVSILRSLGIPCRAFAGMLLDTDFNGRKNVFVYHMWAEAFIKNKWVIVDAANPGRKYANRYIAFAYHHLQTEMPLAYLRAVTAIKSMSVEYVK
ncbi:MAG: transglutaminase domain-containing protein [Spirochaetes bacterium]|nr:transglutaminase domain-containing protein [Spirochaetota bacterium]